MLLGLWLAAGDVCGAEMPAALPPSLEYKVKAAYLFNFAKYVEWPARAFPGEDAPIVIGILGQVPFDSVMEETIAGRQIGKRRVVVRRSKRAEDLRDAHVLFIGVSERERLTRILTVLKGRSVLTVSEMPRFCLNGGMVAFVLEREVVRFDVNLDNAEQAGLKISARMLATARVVQPRKRS